MRTGSETVSMLAWPAVAEVCLHGQDWTCCSSSAAHLNSGAFASLVCFGPFNEEAEAAFGPSKVFPCGVCPRVKSPSACDGELTDSQQTKEAKGQGRLQHQQGVSV